MGLLLEYSERGIKSRPLHEEPNKKGVIRIQKEAPKGNQRLGKEVNDNIGKRPPYPKKTSLAV